LARNSLAAKLEANIRSAEHCRRTVHGTRSRPWKSVWPRCLLNTYAHQKFAGAPPKWPALAPNTRARAPIRIYEAIERKLGDPRYHGRRGFPQMEGISERYSLQDGFVLKAPRQFSRTNLREKTPRPCSICWFGRTRFWPTTRQRRNRFRGPNTRPFGCAGFPANGGPISAARLRDRFGTDVTAGRPGNEQAEQCCFISGSWRQGPDTTRLPQDAVAHCVRIGPGGGPVIRRPPPAEAWWTARLPSGKALARFIFLTVIATAGSTWLFSAAAALKPLIEGRFGRQPITVSPRTLPERTARLRRIPNSMITVITTRREMCFLLERAKGKSRRAPARRPNGTRSIYGRGRLRSFWVHYPARPIPR